MSRFMLPILLCLPATALGQASRPLIAPYPATPPPRVTPYLGLLRGGNPAANYYLTVQPEVRRGLDAQLYPPPTLPEIRDPRTPQELVELFGVPIQPQSGHQTGFNTTGSYFQYPSRQRVFMPYQGREPDPLPRGKK